MQRYNLWSDDFGNQIVDRETNGEWVRADDAEARIRELEARVAELEANNARLADDVARRRIATSVRSRPERGGIEQCEQP